MPAQCSIYSGTLSCAFGTLGAGATRTVHISSPSTQATAADSPVENTADVGTSNDGTDTASDQISVLGTHIHLAIHSFPTRRSSDLPIGFTITVTNPGPGAAKDVALTD